MDNDNVININNLEQEATDLLTGVLKAGAQKLLAHAIQQEVADFLAKHEELKIADNKQAIIRNGYLPERTVQTGIGPVSVKVPKVRDRSNSGIKFNSAIIPPYLKRSDNMEEFIPWLYLRGISTNKFDDCMSSLFGEQAKGFSASTICRLKKVWEQEYVDWCKRDFSRKKYAYIWADGVYFKVKSEASKQCVLVIIGVLDDGTKELISITDGYRESEQSWYEVLLDLNSHGLTVGPKLAIGDGALGFWNALTKVYPETKHQRCWVHKTANILNKVPKSVQPKMKAALQEIWMSETKANALKAYKTFIKKYQDKYPAATRCLDKDKEKMLTFYDFPAAHWGSIRTTNPIESMFATIRLRSSSTKNCGFRSTILAMVFKLAKCAEQKWYRLKGFKQLGDVITGVKFVDGIKKTEENLNREVA